MRVATFLLLASSLAFGQASSLVKATDYAKWAIQSPGGTMGPGGSISLTANACYVNANGHTIIPFVANLAVKITDASGASESTTINNASVSGTGCSIGFNNALSHTSFVVTSGDGGLQEAINDLKPGGGTVQITQDWPGTIAQITGASGASNVSIIDVRTNSTYTWNGSAYSGAYGELAITDPTNTPNKFFSLTPAESGAPKFNYLQYNIANGFGATALDQIVARGWNINTSGTAEDLTKMSSGINHESKWYTSSSAFQTEYYFQVANPSQAAWRPFFYSADNSNSSIALYRNDQYQFNAANNTQLVKLTNGSTAWDWTFTADNAVVPMGIVNRNAALAQIVQFRYVKAASTNSDYWDFNSPSADALTINPNSYVAIGTTPQAPARLFVYTGTSTDDGVQVQGHSTTPFMADFNVDGVSVFQVTPSGASLAKIVNATGHQLFNSTTTCTTGASVGATCTTAAITLPVAYSDTNYRVACTGLTPTNVPIVQTVAKSNTTFTITVAALTAAAASFASFDCTVGHN